MIASSIRSQILENRFPIVVASFFPKARSITTLNLLTLLYCLCSFPAYAFYVSIPLPTVFHGVLVEWTSWPIQERNINRCQSIFYITACVENYFILFDVSRCACYRLWIGELFTGLWYLQFCINLDQVHYWIAKGVKPLYVIFKLFPWVSTSEEKEFRYELWTLPMNMDRYNSNIRYSKNIHKL